MHPEVVSDEPGSCPKCGMHLVPVEEAGGEDHSGHAHYHGDHAGHAGQGGHAGHGGGALAEGIEPHFMSMVELTRDLPRSSDGLQMEWITAPFGPFFPGLPGGLGLELTLDGDTVAGAHAGSLVAPAGPLVAAPTAPGAFTERLAAMMPLAPVSHALLAVRALEAAAGIEPDEALARGRAAALERERIASHLGWLASFGTHSGFVWLAEKAASLQLQARQADVEGLAALTPAITAFLRRLQRAPLLGMRLSGMARISPNAEATGPVLRASGRAEDARSEDPAATSLGFSPAVRAEGDALARLRLRCDEIIASLGLISAAGSLILPAAPEVGEATGEGAGLVETPRGAARLELRLEAGRVVEARLEAPSDRHLPLIEPLTGQQELGDALTAIVSLDLSPWEIRP
jgi:Ni,Fe-hydrogenase III large subunit